MKVELSLRYYFKTWNRITVPPWLPNGQGRRSAVKVPGKSKLMTQCWSR